MERRLAAILAADVVGYSRLIGADEAGTLGMLRSLRKDLVEPTLKRHRGRIVKLMGDGLLAEFASVVDATAAAVEIQEAMPGRSAHLPEFKRIELRIGIHVGDVVVEDGDLFGDGVNIAARLQEISDPNGVAISDSAYRELRGKLDIPFQDAGEKSLKNIVDPVRTWKWSATSLPADALVADARLTVPDKPSIAVLPFDNMSGDPEQAYFADGISEDIITELSRLRGFFVIARNSSFVYKGQSIPVSEVARDLGVRYVLEGSVRRAGNRVRVTAQLIEGDNGTHIWAERYDRTLDDIFELQDEITQQIVGALEPSMIGAEAERLHRQRPENLDAWGCVAQAMPLIWSWSESDYAAAEPLLRQAIDIDPGYARAHSTLAVGLVTTAWFGRGGPGADFSAQAIEEAKTAVELDANDPWGHLALGFVHGYRRNSRDAFAAIEQALTLNPNFALAHGLCGLVLGWAGEAERALAEIELAERLSPRDVINIHYPTMKGVACFAAGDYEAAAEFARNAIRLRSDATGAHRVLAASCGQLGAVEEAQAAGTQLRKLQPDITLEWVHRNLPVPVSDFRERYIEGLRTAGIPE